MVVANSTVICSRFWWLVFLHIFFFLCSTINVDTYMHTEQGRWLVLQQKSTSFKTCGSINETSGNGSHHLKYLPEIHTINHTRDTHHTPLSGQISFQAAAFLDKAVRLWKYLDEIYQPKATIFVVCTPLEACFFGGENRVGS